MAYNTRSELEVAESPVSQADVEKRSYQFDWANEGTPSNPTITVYDITNAADVTTDVLAAGSPSISGDVVTTQKVQNLTGGNQYRLQCLATVGGNTLLAFCIIPAISTS